MDRDKIVLILDNLYKQAATFGQTHSFSTESFGQSVSLSSLTEINQSIEFYERKLKQIDGGLRKGTFRMVQR